MVKGITDTALRAKWRGKDRWLSNGGTRGAGRLVAKISQSGPIFYFQYFDPEKRKRFLPIAPYDGDGKRGMRVQEAVDRAAELSKLYRNGAPNLHEHFERQRGAEERARRAEEEARKRAEEDSQRSTLRQLLDAYSAHLERAGKQSASDAAGIFKLHVFDVAPDLAARRAADVTADDFGDLIAKLAEKGKGRTAAKLRSYLRAAYSLAIKARSKPAMASSLKTFGVTSNPLSGIDAMSEYNRARDRYLDEGELRAFLKRLDAVPQGMKRDAVELSLSLGGQRSAQLLRVRPVDVDLHAGTITLYDGKGARKQPRKHMLPLTKKQIAILRRLIDELPDGAQFIFTTDGETGMRPETASELVTEISDAMVKDRDAREAFQMRDLRKTAETTLARLKVSSDVRAMILSHGLGGIQKRHYDFYDYADEMRAALEKWQRYLDRLRTGEAAQVVKIKTAIAL